MLFKSLFNKNKKQIDVINFEKLFILMGLYFDGEENKKIGVLKQVDYLGENNKHITSFNKCIIGITDYGYISRFRVPYDFTKENIEGLQDKLELQTNKSIDIEFISTINGAYFDIKVFNHKLKEKYDFELIEPKSRDKITVNLGYGRLGLIDFTIDKHIGLFGESGSGKSTTLKGILTQLVLNYKPSELQLYLSDNKGGTELNIYSNIEHTQAFTKDLNGLKQIFKTLSEESERRYNLLFDKELESISEYNKRFKNNKLPTILFVIEEFAAIYKDKTVKNMLLLALSQWRSINIFILITTQRPSSKVLEGDLKCNIGKILGMKTLDSNNSNVVIDRYNLLNNLRGNGHGYIRHNGKLEEFQSFYIDHTQVKKMIKPYIKPKVVRDEKTSIDNTKSELNQNININDKLVTKHIGTAINQNRTVTDTKEKNKIIDLSFIDNL